MSIFSQIEVKKMIQYVEKNQMTFSRMVELLNDKAYKFTNKKECLTMMDVVRNLECFISSNENLKSKTEFKFKELISYLKNEVIESCNENLKSYNNE
jgi:hypothetical protein